MLPIFMYSYLFVRKIGSVASSVALKNIVGGRQYFIKLFSQK